MEGSCFAYFVLLTVSGEGEHSGGLRLATITPCRLRAVQVHSRTGAVLRFRIARSHVITPPGVIVYFQIPAGPSAIGGYGFRQHRLTVFTINIVGQVAA